MNVITTTLWSDNHSYFLPAVIKYDFKENIPKTFNIEKGSVTIDMTLIKEARMEVGCKVAGRYAASMVR